MNWGVFAMFVALPVAFILAVVFLPWGRDDRPRSSTTRRPN